MVLLSVEFCQALEEDAHERAERRKEAERAGKERKRRGNEAFRREKYNSAVEHYTEAIQQMPWDVTLYTNRALVRVVVCDCVGGGGCCILTVPW